MQRNSARIGQPTAFVQLVGVNQINASVVSEVRRGAVNIEVALALDVTGSMGSVDNPSSRINAAKAAAIELVNTVVQDDQTPNYSKMALIPWSSAVNLGTLAGSVRGAATQHTTITGASWVLNGSTNTRRIETISKHATQPLIKTTSNHTYQTGDTVNITAITGGTNFTALNGHSYTITRKDADEFWISANTSGTGSYDGSSGRTTTYNARAIAAITEANPAQITTGMAHGLVTGDYIVITSASGDDMDELNDNWFQVTVTDSTHFTINGDGSIENTTGDGPYNANTGVMRKCIREKCQIEITSPAHGLEDTEHVHINNASWLNNVEGDDEVGNVWEVVNATADTYVLKDSTGWDMGAYAANGRSWCTQLGCEYYYFNNKDDDPDYSLHRIRTCVTERVDANQYTDAAPSTTFVGRHYTSSASDCLTPQIIPLTATKSTLTTAITNLTTNGTTAGQVGTAWAWYMLAPNFSYLFTGTGQQPAAYDAPHTKKIAIIMTDGEYNTPYCNGVVANDHGAGSSIIANSRAINCNATNGSPLTQAAAVCTAMKAAPANIKVYTVGFQLGSDTGVITMLTNCASSPSDAFLADNATELMDAFEQIGNDISDLRLAQ